MQRKYIDSRHYNQDSSFSSRDRYKSFLKRESGSLLPIIQNIIFGSLDRDCNKIKGCGTCYKPSLKLGTILKQLHSRLALNPPGRTRLAAAAAVGVQDARTSTMKPTNVRSNKISSVDLSIHNLPQDFYIVIQNKFHQL